MSSVFVRPFKKILDLIELIGNKLPHPATLFALLALLVVVASWLAKMASVQAIHPGGKRGVCPYEISFVKMKGLCLKIRGTSYLFLKSC